MPRVVTVGMLGVNRDRSVAGAGRSNRPKSFQGTNHVSNFARSGVLAVSEIDDQAAGWSIDAMAPERLRIGRRRAMPDRMASAPHIIMVLDEASFDITAVPGIKVPPGYRDHFQSFDGKARTLVVEGAGGPTWYTEYNVLTGLSARSYGRSEVLRHAHRRRPRRARPAAGAAPLRLQDLQPLSGLWRVPERAALPDLRPASSVSSTLEEMQRRVVEPDRFYYDQALRMLERERGRASRCSCSSTPSPTIFPGTTAIRPDRHAGMARPRQRHRGRRIPPPADDERARLRAISSRG